MLHRGQLATPPSNRDGIGTGNTTAKFEGRDARLRLGSSPTFGCATLTITGGRVELARACVLPRVDLAIDRGVPHSVTGDSDLARSHAEGFGGGAIGGTFRGRGSDSRFRSPCCETERPKESLPNSHSPSACRFPRRPVSFQIPEAGALNDWETLTPRT